MVTSLDDLLVIGHSLPSGDIAIGIGTQYCTLIEMASAGRTKGL
jgi:hypothetical protein